MRQGRGILGKEFTPELLLTLLLALHGLGLYNIPEMAKITGSTQKTCKMSKQTGFSIKLYYLLAFMYNLIAGGKRNEAQTFQWKFWQNERNCGRHWSYQTCTTNGVCRRQQTTNFSFKQGTLRVVCF